MTAVPPRLSIVTLGARDMGVLRSFYTALGWPELPNGDQTWTGFMLGGVLLALYPLADLAAEAAPESAEATPGSAERAAKTAEPTPESTEAAPESTEAAPGSAEPAGWRGVTLACTVDSRDAVDQAFQAAVAAGATAVAAATDRSWGGRSAFIADPEGNRWEITWGPGATFDERGALLSWG
jgi:uncharacterized protein